MTHLFSPLTLRRLTLPHRIAVSPMCQYSCVDGFANDWHLVHLGSRAVGGAALVVVEATAVTPEGRITPGDLGVWSDAHAEPLARIVSFLHEQGSAACLQLAHAGRKGSTKAPWLGPGLVAPADGGWQPVSAGTVPFSPDYPVPRALAREEVRGIVSAFADAAVRARDAGFDIVEVHAGHGYLLHEFYSPLVNQRDDEYGGTFANRIRATLEVIDAVRRVWPDHLPVFLRISSTDWAEGGWGLDDSVALAREAAARGVDLVDCSSGGAVPVPIPAAPGYQIPFAERIRREVGVATGAVGLITDAQQADRIVRDGQADLVLLAREMLRDPYWPTHAAAALGQPIAWPRQHLRAAPAGTAARQPFAGTAV